jgi:hypothetical protein
MRRAVTAFVVLVVACSSAEPETQPPASAPSPDDAGSGSLDAAGTDGSPLESGDATYGDDPDSPAPGDALDAGPEAAPDDACAVSGAPGQCTAVTACAALGDHTSFAGYCPGPAEIQCCIVTPSTADDPPIPAGYELMAQSQVTAAMTAWAVAILDDPTTYPMFDTVTKTFGTVTVLARVEWHPPDFQNSAVHRGVTLYVPV